MPHPPALPTAPTEIPPFPDTGYAPIAQEIAALMGTRNDVVLIQAEAAVALEASAHSLGRPGLRALNIVTSLYGRWFGAWLRRAGAEVVDLIAAPGLPISTDAVAEALKTGRFGLIALVHAESASGILNPLPEIMALARAHGALSVVDVVASLGGHEVAVDHLGIDIAVMGPQKALGGPAGVSAISVSERGWQEMAPASETPSILSLADQKALWLDLGRGALPGTPSSLEFHALAGALAQIRPHGLAALETRHRQAGRAARAGVAALIGRNWMPAAQASNLVTAVPLPEGVRARDLLAAMPRGHGLGQGVGPAEDLVLRLNHTGARADLGVVLGELSALAAGLERLGFQPDLAQALGLAAKAHAST